MNQNKTSSNLFSKRKDSKGEMTMNLLVTVIVFILAAGIILAVLAAFVPEVQTAITRLVFGLGESVPSFG